MVGYVFTVVGTVGYIVTVLGMVGYIVTVLGRVGYIVTVLGTLGYVFTVVGTVGYFVMETWLLDYSFKVSLDGRLQCYSNLNRRLNVKCNSYTKLFTLNTG